MIDDAIELFHFGLYIWLNTIVWWELNEVILLMFNVFVLPFSFPLFYYISLYRLSSHLFHASMSLYFKLNAHLYLRIVNSQLDFDRMRRSQPLVHYQSML